jgi:hypothetical protein
MSLRFEPLPKRHDRTTCSCGNSALDRWFRTRAGQNPRRGVSRVFVALDEHGLAGSYTLSMFSLALEAIPADIAAMLPKYPDVPAALIGRLARAEPKDAYAKAVYESLGFTAFPLRPNRLFLLAETAAAAISKADD